MREMMISWLLGRDTPKNFSPRLLRRLGRVDEAYSNDSTIEGQDGQGTTERVSIGV